MRCLRSLEEIQLALEYKDTLIEEERCSCYYGGSCPTDYVHIEDNNVTKK